MKTGFIQGFVNIMKPKPYPYHGMLRSCGIQPEIPPYVGPDMKPAGQEWEIVFEKYIGTGYMGSRTFKATGFIPSSDPHLCANKTYCTHNVYYFAEVYLWQHTPGKKMYLTRADGLNCKLSVLWGEYLYVYKAWFNYQWGASDMLFKVTNVGPSSFGRLWKSKTGEFPGYYPMPQKEYIRV